MAHYLVYDAESGEIVLVHSVVAAEGPPPELSDADVLAILPAEAAGRGRLAVLKTTTQLPSGARYRVDPTTKEIVLSESRIASASAPAGPVPFLTPEALDAASPDALVQALSGLFGKRSPEREIYAFSYLRQSRYALLKRIAARDAKLGYVVAAGMTVFHQAACSALRDMLDDFTDSIAPELGLGEENDVYALGTVLDDALFAEGEGGDDPSDIVARGRAFRRLYDHISHGEGLTDRLNRVLAEDAPPKPGGGAGATEAPAFGEEFDSPKIQLTNDPEPFRRRHLQHGRKVGRNHHYWALWTSVEWPKFLYAAQTFGAGSVGPGFPLGCQTKENDVRPDSPELVEMPPAAPPAVKATDIMSGTPVSSVWQARVKNYVPPPNQVFFPTSTPETFLYTSSLQIPGVAGYDWSALGKRLSDKVDGLDKNVLDRIVNILKGAQVEGFSLAPVANAASAGKDALNTIVQQIIEWVIDQLDGFKFPPTVVTMKATLLQNNPDPECEVHYFTTASNGEKQELPLPHGTAANSSIILQGESKAPGKIPSPTLGQILDGLPWKNGAKQDYKEPMYWVSPGQTHAVHVFVPLVSGKTHLFGAVASGKYWLALRTEMRVVEVEFV
jgi:hypothetical protein